ncbi:MAG TPA: S41 family peptidase [Allosphingosinicella sp.]|jgi:hypothetical protein
MKTVSLLAVAALSIAALSASAQSQPAAQAAPAPQPIDARAVVAEVRRVIAERYVLPERRPALDAVLAEGLAAGRYDTRDPSALAERINADLERVGRDRHLGFSHNPQQAAIIAAAQDRAAPDPAGRERQVRAANHGVTELRLLPGNIRYMAYDGFMWMGPESAAALDTAMRFLAGGDAVIIDIRRNGGGSPDAVQYLVSHFMEADRPLVTFHMNGQPSPDRLSTLAELPAGRMVGKPLYVLTSGGTASAAEEFAGHVGGYRLGELIGETTAGAGFRNDLVAVPGGFVLSVSVGRAVLASTGRDWEAVGIVPTTPVPVAQALEHAQVRALRRLAAAAAPPERPRLEARATLLLAQLQPVATALPLSAYAGAFGERTISIENGRLALQRNGGPKLVMVPIGPNLFALEADATTRVQFVVSGDSASGFELIRGDGSRVSATRTP